MKPEFHPINIFKGEARTPGMLAKNANAKIPVLEDGDFVLWESNAILGYLAAKHPEKNLLPTDPKGRADVDRWLFWQTAHLGPSVGKVAFERIVKNLAGLGAPDQAMIDAGTKDFGTCCSILDGALKGKEYVAGRMSIADFALIAFFSLAQQAG